MEQALGEPVVIRFDGLDADDHFVELSTLAESLQGLARIIAVTSHFAVTRELVLRKDRLDVRVVIGPPRDGCVVFDALVQFAHQHPLFTTFASSTVSTLTATAITYIFTRAANKREEMKHLSAALGVAIKELGGRDQATVDRLLATVDKMADALTPAVKKAVAPVGVSARTLSVGMVSAPEARAVIDEADKAAILSEATLRVDDERAYDVLITELDMDTGACHVNLAGEPEDERKPARITDPAFSLTNNDYALSMAARTRLLVTAKATLRDGVIDRLYISNLKGRPRGGGELELAPPAP